MNYSDNPFMPRGYLETYNSLNRLVMGEKPDSPQSVELLSSDVLTDTIETYKDELQIPDDMHRSGYGAFVSALAESDRTERGDRARLILDQWVDNAVRFFDILLTGRAVHRDLRKGWEDIHWQWWKNRKTIVIGGGLTKGYSGRELEKKLEHFLRSTGRKLIMPEHRGDLPILGALIAVPSVTEGQILGMDYGHTGVKRAIFMVEEGRVKKMIPLPYVPVERTFHMTGSDFSIDPLYLRDFTFGVLDSSLELAFQKGEVKGVGISMANYIQAGSVVPRGMYGHLKKEGDDGCYIQGEIEDVLKSRGVNPVALSLLHDGTAAANCYFGENDPAVVIFGSAIGGGFPYSRPSLSWEPINTIKSES